MARRLVVPSGALRPGRLELPPELAHYAKDVLRLGVGAALELFDGEGGVAPASVAAVAKRAVTLEVGELVRHPPPRPSLVLLQGVAKGDKMDAVMRQATELGAARIVPVVTARAVARQDKRVARWRTIAEDAVRVAGHYHRPAIDEVTELEGALSAAPSGLRLVLALDGARALRAYLEAAAGGAAAVTVLVGPEGGLTSDEVAEAQAAGFEAIHLGPRTLRTETAGPAALAIVGCWAGALE